MSAAGGVPSRYFSGALLSLSVLLVVEADTHFHSSPARFASHPGRGAVPASAIRSWPGLQFLYVYLYVSSAFLPTPQALPQVAQPPLKLAEYLAIQ